ncbi:MAG: hypothetical protein E7654_00435 [Ruminococcaceae bacterium]|nr:hypothetical protein [Oscillospiraceae bacterium]
MVEKISLNVVVPSLNLEHNFLIPAEMNVEGAAALILRALMEEYPGVGQRAAAGAHLMQMSTGKLLNSGCNFRQLGIAQGEKLLLM